MGSENEGEDPYQKSLRYTTNSDSSATLSFRSPAV